MIDYLRTGLKLWLQLIVTGVAVGLTVFWLLVVMANSLAWITSALLRLQGIPWETVVYPRWMLPFILAGAAVLALVLV